MHLDPSTRRCIRGLAGKPAANHTRSQSVARKQTLAGLQEKKLIAVKEPRRIGDAAHRERVLRVAKITR